MDKNKKKTLTISSNLKKKIDTSSIGTSGKKSFSVDKKNHQEIINHSIKYNQLQMLILIKNQKKEILLENL